MTNKLCGLYALTNPEAFAKYGCEETIRQLINGGARIIQYRDKTSASETGRKIATQIKKLCSKAAVIFIVNDDIELALAVAADGVHLGKKDAEVETARRLLGEDKIIGVSCYNQIDLARNAEQAGANYVAFGSFYPSVTKPDAVTVDTKLLTQARQELSIPICAIGGITGNNAQTLINAGADMLAVITDLYKNPDIRQNAEILSVLF